MRDQVRSPKQPGAKPATRHVPGPGAGQVAHPAHHAQQLIDASPRIAAQRQAIRSMHPIQRVPYTGAELNQLNQIAIQMGVNPADVEFHEATGSNHADGNKIYIQRALLGNQAELEFTTGHELSHYLTGDTSRSGVGNLLHGSVLAGALGTATGGLYPALIGGTLGALTEYAGGGGLINSAITGLSVAGAAGLGPMGTLLGSSLGGLLGPGGAMLGGMAGGLVGGSLGALASIPVVSKLFEVKSDIHSASRMGTAGGISRFNAQHQKNVRDANYDPLAGIDPLHPPLPMRSGYLGVLNNWLGW
ncbi:M48 family metalloprotease [Roseateles sp. DAIF2]|uniref:M48 family metalloprotease n=1 Tax=Roseateles sp. DAIF2 TaxID=2714952 RepID=UPI001BC92282|nr:M48 family metalloprotease [Roseateles sp. DAIF2]